MTNPVFKNRFCLRCGVEFTPTQRNQRYCDPCRPLHRQEYQKEYKKTQKTLIHKRYHQTRVDVIQPPPDPHVYNRPLKRVLQVRDSVRRWRQKHPEQHRKRNSEWRSANKDKVNFMNRRRERQIRGVTGNFTWDEWEETKAKFNHTCPSCGKSEPEIKLTVDHIVPLSKGGTNYIDNIQPLCGRCNSSKFNKVVIF